MKPEFEDRALLRCGSDSEVVGVHEFTPRVSLIVDLFPGTRNYRRMTLQWVNDDVGYSTEVYGRTFVSRGPRLRSREQKSVRLRKN